MARQVIVTGGSSGMGRAIAARFARAGDSVVITGRNQEKLERTATELGVRCARVDHADPAQVTAFAGTIDGDVHVLVNSAGANTDVTRTAPAPPLLEEIARTWRTGFDANLLPALLTTYAFLPRMGEGAAVVTIGSGAAEVASTSYGAMKAALAAWTAGLSRQVGPLGITANCVVPGYTPDTDFFPTALPEEMVKGLLQQAHNRRAGTSEDIAGTVLFLASEDARHITAQAIHVSGGSHPTR